MTDQNNAAQAAEQAIRFSDDQLMAIATAAWSVHSKDAYSPDGLLMACVAVQAALLSKLRAPVADERPGGTRWPVLRAMARNYTAGKHTWDALDADACEQAAEEIRHLRAALASAPVADERAADLFREALAWGYVYGPKLSNDQWERMRDETAQQFSQRLAAIASPPVDDGELRTAFNEWIDKTDFIQQRIASGELPVKYLGWHRADVMRDLIDAALASAPVAGEEQPTDFLATWEALRHAGNEWADMACNGIQWMRNVKEGISTPDEALENLASNLTHCRATQALASITPPAAPQASEAMRKPITTLAEFCAEADRIGLTRQTFAAMLAERPEFADCLPQTDKDGGDCAKGAGDEHERLAFEAWAATEVPAHKLGRAPWPYEDQYNWVSMDYAWSMWRKIRAALSAQPGAQKASNGENNG